MPRTQPFVPAALTFLLALTMAPSSSCAEPVEQPLVVLELFTSQGCSSCPPAERLLAELAEDPRIGSRLIPLRFHVDYWNRLGWTDPYSSPQWSARQEQYARALVTGRLYTPQLVIAGRDELVGSQEKEVRERVDRALAQPTPVDLNLDLEVQEGRRMAKVTAHNPTGRPVTILLALVESGRETAITAGENRHRKSPDDHVVRRLEHVLDLRGKSRGTHAEPLDIPSSWTGDLAVVALAQDAENLAIQGAVRVELDTTFLGRPD